MTRHISRGPAAVLALGLVWALMVLTPGTSQAQVFVDDTPEPSWHLDGTVYATLIVGDSVFVGGQFKNAVSATGEKLARNNLAAFSLETGEPLRGWRADAASIVRGLTADGTSLYVSGSFQKINNVARSRLAKVSLADGTVDPAFAPVFDNTVRITRLDGGSLLVGGAFTSVNGISRSRLARLDATTGAVDPAWSPSANNTVYGMALDAGHRRLYVSGQFTSVAGASRTGMARLDADTGVIAATVFASAARPTLGLDLSPDGSSVFGAGGGSTNAAAAWNAETGTRLWRQTTNGDIQAIKYFAGSVFFGFHDGYQGDTHIKLLVVDAATGALDPDFRPTFDEFWGVWALDVTDEGLVIGGDFTNVSGVPSQGFARFKRTKALPPPPPTTYNYVDSTTPWRYWDQGTRPNGWETPGFDDATWPSGLTQLGYGDGDEQTVIGYGPSTSSRYLSYYFRTTVDVPAVGDTVELLLCADDGAVVYVNGVEAARDNMPAGPVTNSTRASSSRSGGAENELRPFALDPSLFHVGSNTIAVEVHQESGGSGDVSFDADVVSVDQTEADLPPTAAFSAAVDHLDVAFDASASTDPEGPIVSYTWNFGDGSTGSGAYVSHTYAAEGSYTVTLRVADQAGSHDTAVRTVEPVGATLDTVVVSAGAAWAWWYRTTAPPTSWAATGFDTSTWAVGNAVLGFGTTVSTNIDTFATSGERPKAARRDFVVSEPSAVERLVLSTVANDGVVVYVNGVEVGRSNMPDGPVTFNTYALSSRSVSVATASPVVIEVPVGLLTAGVNVVSAETHLNYRGTKDVTFDLTATLTTRR